MTWPFVVGLGSHHGDDQAGWLIVEALQQLGYPRSQLRQARHPAELLDLLDSTTDFVVCDACENSQHPGSIQRCSWPAPWLPSLGSHGTHDFGLTEVLELAAQLHHLPSNVNIWAVAGTTWTPGESPCKAVQSAAQRVAELIWEELPHA